MIWTPAGVNGLLVLAGMPANRRAEFVAIAECESDLDDHAVSPTGAIGLWQVEPYTAQSLGFGAQEMYSPDTNALATVRLSGGGANCAAWDTCYADIGRSGRYSYLNWPEPGSCAADRLAGVVVAVGGGSGGGGAPPPFPGVSGTLAATVASMQTLNHVRMPANGALVASRAAGARHLYTG